MTGFPEIVKAENFVIDHNLGDVISQSFGATEETFPNKGAIVGLRSAFKNAALHGVTVLGASGDSGSTDYKLNLIDLYDHQVNSWPLSDPLVTSVGGTQPHLDAAGNRLAPDNVWNDIPIGIDAAGGGGPSHVFPRPLFQFGTRTGAGLARATPDISLSAAVDGGVLVYLGFPGLDPGYYIVGGTSEASPLFAGVVAIADQIAGHRLGWINPRLYALGTRASKGIVDITIGDNTFTLGRPGLHPAVMEEGAERAGEDRDHGDRVGLQEHVERARGGGDRVGQLGGDGEQLCARPEQRVAERGDPGRRRVTLEEVGEHAGDEVERDRHREQGGDACAQVLGGHRCTVIEKTAV